MTYDLLETFGKFFENDKVVVDTYELADGFYYVVDNENKIRKLEVLNHQGDDSELEDYVKIRDFYSKYIASNKAIDTTYTEENEKQKYTMLKKICSNNIYTLFFKNKCLLGICNKEATKDAVPMNVFKKGIEKYYESLKKLGTGKKEEILLNERYTEEEIQENKTKMFEALDLIYEDLKDREMPKETWIKIFLNKDIDEYKRVANIYLKLKLFNTNDNNIELNHEIYGANNYNFGLNSKKPYLELKSTPFKVGSLIDSKKIETLNKMYIWLYNNATGKNLLKLPDNWNFNGIPKEEEQITDKNTYILRVAGNNGNARIDDYIYTSRYNTKIRKFTCRDYLKIDNPIVFETENIYGLQWYTNNIWFTENEQSTRNYIKDSYYDYDQKIAKSMLSNWKKELLKQYKNLFLELFETEQEKNFRNEIDNLAINIVENMYIDNLKQSKKYIYNPRKAFNLWIGYKQYFNKKGEDETMKISNLQEQCKEIVEGKDKIETDEQYYFLAGQAAYYLLSQSKADKLTQDVTEPFVKANTIKKLKDELKFLYEKYSYNIYLNHTKFNNILSQLLLAEPEEKIRDNKEILLAGILSNNLFYSNLNNGGNENGENE